MLQLGMKPLVPSASFAPNRRSVKAELFVDAVADTAEIPAMTELQTTYGKTTHTWCAA